MQYPRFIGISEVRRRSVVKEVINFLFIGKIVSLSLPKLFPYFWSLVPFSLPFWEENRKICSKTVTAATQKREDLFSCSTWSRDCDNNRLHGREKKENYIKLKIDLPIEFLNKFFLSICNTPIQNNFLILCFTSINCILFLFGKSRNRSSSKFITFSNKQPKENGAIWLAIILLSLNNGKSGKCFNSRLSNTTFGFFFSNV